MKANLARIEKNQVTLEVEVQAERFDKALEQAYHKVVKRVNIPGFRKGKVPRRILEAQYGKEILFEDALDILVPEAYFQAVKETSIEPIDRPQIEIVKVEVGQPVIFKAIVDVKPEVTLGVYKGLGISKEVAEITPEEVDKELEALRQRHAKLLTLEEGTVEQGDTATIDFEGFVDGVAFDGGKGENYPLVIGSRTFIPGFEDQLIGAAVGQEVDVKVTFPEDYHADGLAGKDALFKVQVKGIKRKELSALDDEFAKDVSEWETLEELKTDLANKLKETAQARAEQELRNEVIDKVVAAAQVEIPKVMVNQRVETIFQDFSRRLQAQGLSMDQYLTYTNTSADDFKGKHREDAEKLVKVDLVLEAIAKAEDLQVSEEDIDKEIVKMAEHWGEDPAKVRSFVAAQNGFEGLKENILFEKVTQFLLEANRA